MRKSLPGVLNRAPGGAHLLADYPANGSALMTQLRESGTSEYPLCGQRTSIPGPSLLRFGGAAREPFCPACVQCDGRYASLYGIAQFGGFDGSIVALFP